MTEVNTREIAEYWFHILKSAPHADSWNIKDSFVEKLAATWPWVQVYFELLSKTKQEDFPWITTLGVYALQETLGLRLDCACAFFFLLQLSRVSNGTSEPIPAENIDQCAKVIDRLARNEDEKTEWLKWFEGLWKRVNHVGEGNSQDNK